mmetsp:Transcript_56810/g.100382  ORF Transcript_56810/g.100382 Transcript_56810/m.100382 type:complete len:418 (-) Transcript_56810:323-1576(-)
MASAAERENLTMDCDDGAAVDDAKGGKRPAAFAPLDEPPPTRGRPTDGPLGGPPVGVGLAAPFPNPPDEDVSAASLFGDGSVHPSEGVTPHGPRTASATARKPTGKVKKVGWLTVSCPANTQGQLAFADVEDAISILLMDLTDEDREGGAIKGVPTSPKLVDDSAKDGPWFFGFDNQWIVMQIVEAAQGKMIVDAGESSLVCNLTSLKTSKDEGAHRLFEAMGFWMELYVPKEMIGHISPNTAAELISNQMKVVITKCKWPSSLPGKPQKRNKFIIKAAPHPNKVMAIPATIQHRKLDQVLMTPMRYRIDPVKFPHLCMKCHQPSGDSCLCAQAKASRAFAQQRRAERSIAAQHAKQAAAGPSTMQNDIAAKLAKRRERAAKVAKCKLQNKCIFFNEPQGCKHGGTSCKEGLHELLD